jgi:hypothetical protein
MRKLGVVRLNSDTNLTPKVSTRCGCFDELAEYFKQQVTDTPGYTWKPETLTKEEFTLLRYHRLFGHAGLQHI